jgi:hypothetical protein
MLGRFLQPDTLIPDPANPQAWNRYSYVVNNPINLNDPSGHSADCGLGDAYCEAGKINTTKRANDIVSARRRASKKDGLKTFWKGLTPEERSILAEGNWQEGGYNSDINNDGVSRADAQYDPLTYAEILVGGAGIARAGGRILFNYATINSTAGVVSIGSNGLYQRTGFTYFEIKPNALYTELNKIGLARLANIAVIIKQLKKSP